MSRAMATPDRCFRNWQWTRRTGRARRVEHERGPGLLSGDELIFAASAMLFARWTPGCHHESRVRYGRFEAAIRLPFAVDVDSATTAYTDGFLSIELPRLAATTLMNGGEPGSLGPKRRPRDDGKN